MKWVFKIFKWFLIFCATCVLLVVLSVGLSMYKSELAYRPKTRELDGHTVHRVPFEGQPLTLVPETGQDFYFYFEPIRGQPSQADYMIGIGAIVPTADEGLMEAAVFKWRAYDQEARPEEGQLLFDVRLSHHRHGRETPVMLKIIYNSQELPGGEWRTAVLNPYAISSADIKQGKDVVYRKNFTYGLVYIVPASVPTEPGGYYKLSIRPVPGIAYPPVPLEVFVEKPFSK